MDEQYDRANVDSVLARSGMPKERREAVLDKIRFPIDLEELQAILGPLGITRDVLINRMGGSP